jgi:hypothetical protein
MRAFELLSEEQTLSLPKLLKDIGRFNNLVQNIKSGNPLYLADGTPVIIDPSEADALLKLHQSGDLQVKGQRLQLKAKDGTMYPLSSFLKTKDYGGQALVPGQEKTSAPTKEGLKLKPKDIGLSDKQIKAGQLGNTISSNSKLKESVVGQEVIKMAKTISEGNLPVLSPTLDKASKSAINDYAGEYLGVWALIKGLTEFNNKEAFMKWLKMPLESLELFFPSKTNNSIADSYALMNPTTGHQINISSKGKGGGAPPSITGLEIPDHIRKEKAFNGAVKFIDIVKNNSTTFQPFVVMNLINEINPSAIPPKFKKFLPWSDKLMTAANESRKTNTPLPKLYASLWNTIKWKKDSTDGGKLNYVVKEACIEMINNGAIPEFEAAVLQILDYNFIQQYSTIKNNVLTFQTQWPAKLDGKITVESKSGATDPTKGSFSFKLSFK